MTKQEMHEFGYLWDGMLPLTLEEALNLFKSPIPCQIYALFNDDSEAAMDTLSDIYEYSEYGCIFGIEE